MVWNRNSSHRQGPVYCMKMPRKRRNARKYGYITEVKRRTQGGKMAGGGRCEIDRRGKYHSLYLPLPQGGHRLPER